MPRYNYNPATAHGGTRGKTLEIGVASPTDGITCSRATGTVNFSRFWGETVCHNRWFFDTPLNEGHYLLKTLI